MRRYINQDALCEVLVTRGITVKDMAALLKYSLSLVYTWYEGARVRDIYVQHICDIMGVDEKEFFCIDLTVGKNSTPYFRRVIQPLFVRTGLDSREIAKALELSDSTIKSWQCGESRTYTKYLIQLSQFFNEPLSYFEPLDGEEY